MSRGTRGKRRISSTDRLSALLHKRPELRALFLHASVIEEGLRWNA